MRKAFSISPHSLTHTFLWPEHERRTPYEAYHDLLRRAVYYRSTVNIHGTQVELKPSQVLCSSTKLAEAWGWHRTTVRDFLLRLQAAGLATIDTRNRATILTLFPDGDAPLKNNSLEAGAELPKPRTELPAESHSTDQHATHSKNRDSSLNPSSHSNKEVLESDNLCTGPEFTTFMLSLLTGPKRMALTPDILKHIRAAYLDKLISEGRLNPVEKDRILLSSNGMKDQAS